MSRQLGHAHRWPAQSKILTISVSTCAGSVPLPVMPISSLARSTAAGIDCALMIPSNALICATFAMKVNGVTSPPAAAAAAAGAAGAAAAAVAGGGGGSGGTFGGGGGGGAFASATFATFGFAFAPFGFAFAPFAPSTFAIFASLTFAPLQLPWHASSPCICSHAAPGSARRLYQMRGGDARGRLAPAAFGGGAAQ